MSFADFTDQGIGIPRDDQSKIFDRFYRVRSIQQQFPGMGIGLYICAMSAGATDFMTKPFDLDQLLGRVKALIEAA